MDAMTLAQLWMGTYLIMYGISGLKNQINGWFLFFGIVLNIVLGVMFVVASGYWPIMVIPATMLVHLITTVATAWKQAVQDAKEAQ